MRSPCVLLPAALFSTLVMLLAATAAAAEPASVLVLLTEGGEEDGSQPAMVVERARADGPAPDQRIRLFSEEVGVLWGEAGSLYRVEVIPAAEPAAPDAWQITAQPETVPLPDGVAEPLAGVDDGAFRRKLSDLLADDPIIGEGEPSAATPVPETPAVITPASGTTPPPTPAAPQPAVVEAPVAQPPVVPVTPPVVAVTPPPPAVVTEAPLPPPVVVQAEATNLGGYDEVLIEYRGQLRPGRARLAPNAMIKEPTVVDVLAADGRFAVIKGHGLWVVQHLVLQQTTQGAAP